MRLLLALLDLIAGRLPKSAAERFADSMHPDILADAEADIEVWEPASNAGSHKAIQALKDAMWCKQHQTIVGDCKQRAHARVPAATPATGASPAEVSVSPTPSAGHPLEQPAELVAWSITSLMTWMQKHRRTDVRIQCGRCLTFIGDFKEFAVHMLTCDLDVMNVHTTP